MNACPEPVEGLRYEKSRRWQNVIDGLDGEIGEGDNGGGLSGGADEDADAAAGEAGVGDAELKTSVQEEAHFPANGPHPNADFARRAGGDISTGEGLLQNESRPAADSFRADSAIAG